mgnify:CR=1 FL=1
MTIERGFGVHALEVWQINSHVKRQGKMRVRGSWGNDTNKVSAHIGRHKSILQVLLEKNSYRKICLPDWERGVLFSFLHG